MTRYYDRYGRRIPAPRHDRVPSGGAVAALAVGMAIAVAIMAAGLALERRAQAEAEAEAPVRTGPRHDSLTVNWTHDGEAIRWYVMEDPDTGIQYLVNDRGGCCVREGVGE